MDIKRAFRATEHREKAKYWAMNLFYQNGESFPDTNALNFFARDAFWFWLVRNRLNDMDENQISKIIVDCCYRIHTTLGPGLLESVYLEVLIYELKKFGLKCEKEVGIPVRYEDIKLDLGFRADLIVENLVIVELKAVEKVLPVHKKQLMTYLRLTGMKLGLLVNFNVNLIKDGIERVVNGL